MDRARARQAASQQADGPISEIHISDGNDFVSSRLQQFDAPASIDDLASISSTGIHLAILEPSYLEKILLGEKTIESRFSRVKGLPFGVVRRGDVLLLKRVSGPIVGIATIDDVSFFGPLEDNGAVALMQKFGDELCLERPFIENKSTSRYATLMWLTDVRRVRPLSVQKRDRRAWLVLRRGPGSGQAEPLQLTFEPI